MRSLRSPVLCYAGNVLEAVESEFMMLVFNCIQLFSKMKTVAFYNYLAVITTCEDKFGWLNYFNSHLLSVYCNEHRHTRLFCLGRGLPKSNRYGSYLAWILVKYGKCWVRSWYKMPLECTEGSIELLEEFIRGGLFHEGHNRAMSWWMSKNSPGGQGL